MNASCSRRTRFAPSMPLRNEHWDTNRCPTGTRCVPHWGTGCTPPGDGVYPTGGRGVPHRGTGCIPLGDGVYPTGRRGVPHWGTVGTPLGDGCTPLGDSVYPTGRRCVPHWGTVGVSLGLNLARGALASRRLALGRLARRPGRESLHLSETPQRRDASAPSSSHPAGGNRPRRRHTQPFAGMEHVVGVDLVDLEELVDGQVVAFGDRVVGVAFFHGVVGVAV